MYSSRVSLIDLLSDKSDEEGSQMFSKFMLTKGKTNNRSKVKDTKKSKRKVKRK